MNLSSSLDCSRWDTGQVSKKSSTGQVRTVQVKSGQNRMGQVGTGPVYLYLELECGLAQSYLSSLLMATIISLLD